VINYTVNYTSLPNFKFLLNSKFKFQCPLVYLNGCLFRRKMQHMYSKCFFATLVDDITPEGWLEVTPLSSFLISFKTKPTAPPRRLFNFFPLSLIFLIGVKLKQIKFRMPNTQAVQVSTSIRWYFESLNPKPWSKLNGLAFLCALLQQ